MQEAVDGFRSAPLWVQAGLVLFALTFVAMVVGPMLRHRRFRSRFDAVAGELAQKPPTGRGWPVAFPITAGSRTFEIRHDLRQSGRQGSYRGPSGYLFTTATMLGGTRWPLHQVEVERLDGVLARLVSAHRPTGDPDFDARFMVVQDGQHVRPGWLDRETRQSIATFFDGVAVPGLLWIRAGELQYIIQDPWTAVNGPAVRTLLERQAALATALERTAEAQS